MSPRQQIRAVLSDLLSALDDETIRRLYASLPDSEHRARPLVPSRSVLQTACLDRGTDSPLVALRLCDATRDEDATAKIEAAIAGHELLRVRSVVALLYEVVGDELYGSKWFSRLPFLDEIPGMPGWWGEAQADVFVRFALHHTELDVLFSQLLATASTEQKPWVHRVARLCESTALDWRLELVELFHQLGDSLSMVLASACPWEGASLPGDALEALEWTEAFLAHRDVCVALVQQYPDLTPRCQSIMRVLNWNRLTALNELLLSAVVAEAIKDHFAHISGRRSSSLYDSDVRRQMSVSFFWAVVDALRGVVERGFDAAGESLFQAQAKVLAVARLWFPDEPTFSLEYVRRHGLIGPASVRGGMTSVVHRFFEAAGRTLEEQDGVLCVPEHVFVSTDEEGVELDADAVEAQAIGARSFFVYRGELPEVVEAELDRLRVAGYPIAPISGLEIQEALADGDAASLLGRKVVSYFDSSNLYQQVNSLRDQRFFFGRAALLTRAGSALARGDALLVTGLRKSGKTSLLHMLRQRMPPRPWCHIDLQQFDRRRHEDWPESVIAQLIASVERWSQQHERQPPLASGADATLLSVLGQFHERQRSRGVEPVLPVLVLDEGERIFPRDGEADAAARLVRAAGVLRAAQQAGLLSIIAADLRPVLSTINVLPGGDTNPFFSFFQLLPLPGLVWGEVREMLWSIGRMMGLHTLDDGLVDDLYNFTGGHPALSRQLAAEAWRRKAAAGVLARGDLRAALNGLHRSGALEIFFQQNVWVPALPDEKTVLCALCEAGGSMDEAALEAPPGVIGALCDQGILTSTDDHLSFAMGGFEKWLQRRLLQQAS